MWLLNRHGPLPSWVLFKGKRVVVSFALCVLVYLGGKTLGGEVDGILEGLIGLGELHSRHGTVVTSTSPSRKSSCLVQCSVQG